MVVEQNISFFVNQSSIHHGMATSTF